MTMQGQGSRVKGMGKGEGSENTPGYRVETLTPNPQPLTLMYWVKGQESSTKAGRKSCLWLLDTFLCARNLRPERGWHVSEGTRYEIEIREIRDTRYEI